jgi:hypothetical protein
VGSQRAPSTQPSTAESFTVRHGMILMAMTLLVNEGRIRRSQNLYLIMSLVCQWLS